MRECNLVQPLWKTVRKFHKKNKKLTTIRSSNSTSGYLPKENKKHYLEKIYAPLWFTVALLTIAKLGKQPKCPLVCVCVCVCVYIHARACTHTQWNITQSLKRIGKIGKQPKCLLIVCMCVYIHMHTHTMEYYSVFKRNNNIDGPKGCYAKCISQTEKDKYMISLIRRILKTKQMSKHNKTGTES